jgi:beta-glucosidase
MLKEDVKKLLDSLSLEEKIGQLVQLGGMFYLDDNHIMTGPMQDMGIDEKKLYQAGSILNTTGAKDVIRLQKEYLEKSEKKIPLLFMADIINGYKTIFPISLALGCSYDFDLVKQTAAISAKEASVSGAHVTFSPMVDLVRDPRWGRVMESYGEDPYLNSQYAKAMVEGYQNENEDGENIFACVKHFAAYGAAMAGREYNTVDIGERSLRQDYLPAYKAAIDAGAKMIMTSFNTVDGIPATCNKHLLQDILRDEWKFDGVVISDFSSIAELMAHGVAENEEQAASLAFNAGCDIDMMTSVYLNHLKDLIDKNKVDMAKIDEAVLRILELKNELGLFENPYRSASEQKEKDVHLQPAFLQKAREAVTKSCVLLKNDEVLPLKKEQKVALIGPYANSTDLCGVWSIHADTSKVVSVLQGMQKQANENCVQYALGTPVSTDPDIIEHLGGFVTENQEKTTYDLQAELQHAIETAKEADVIVVALGEHYLESGEGAARMHLDVAAHQMELLKELSKLNKPIVTLLFNGRPLVLSEVLSYSDALLECWYPGIEGGNGIADLLYGTVSPSAKLTMSFPRCVGQIPVYYNSLNTGRPYAANNRFTSHYIDGSNEPLFDFGYGLSYTSFDYGNVELDSCILEPNKTIKAAVTVTNTGKKEAEEIVQLYIHDCFGSVSRPKKELKGVCRLSLAPGQSKKAEFEIDEDMLKFFTSQNCFEAESGDFEVFIGPDSSTQNKAFFTLKK